MLIITLVVLMIYTCFQLLYIFFPLFTVKSNHAMKKAKREKGISIMIPVYNEERVILDCLKGLVNLLYKDYEAILINDGSSDKTLELLIDHLQLVPTLQKLPTAQIPHREIKEIYESRRFSQLFVIDKKNGGKADALNTGIEYSVKDIVITLDADSVLDPHALQSINSAFEDKDVVAAGGMVQIGQGFKGNYSNPIPTFNQPGIVRFQILQYLTAFYLHKLTQTKMKSIIVIAGAFGAFQKKALLEVGGFRRTVGEDMDITLKIHRLIKTNKQYQNSQLVFIPHALCYTECPGTLKDLYHQRIRWQKAFIDCVMNYKDKFFKQFGWSFSLFFLMDSLLLGTLNVFALLLVPIMLIMNPEYYMVAVALFTMTFFLSSYQSMAALIISRRYGTRYSPADYWKITLFIPFEVLTYRFLVVIFVLMGTILYFKNKDTWHVSRRVGTNANFYGDTETP